MIASLTIGSGELIFSSRAGSLFGYRVLWFFLLVLVLKWILVFTAARQMVLTAAHPFQRWSELPGPRGWFPLVFFLLTSLLARSRIAADTLPRSRLAPSQTASLQTVFYPTVWRVDQLPFYDEPPKSARR